MVRAMTTFRDGDLERVRISGAGDVAAAVPHLLGFHPDDSLVVLCMSRPRLRMGLTMRFDLVSAPSTARLAVEAAVRAEAAGAEEVMLVCYPTAPDPDLDVVSRHDLPHAELLDRRCDEMRQRGIDVQDAVVVSCDRWRSYLCDDDCCGMSRALPSPSPHLGAVCAWRGPAVLADRRAVVASLDPLGGDTEVSMRQAYDRQADLVVEQLRAVGSVDAYRRGALAAYDEALTRVSDPRARLADDEAAYLVLSLEDAPTRDAAAARGLDRGDESVALLTYLARRAYPPEDAAVCTTLAWVLCLDGATLRARIALDRARRSDPGYSLASLLEQVIAEQVPPTAIRALTRRALSAAADD